MKDLIYRQDAIIGENLVTDKEQPCIEVHLNEKKPEEEVPFV